ncbi:MAG: transposase [Candidatus Omnitrophica bacterium]|nr:transposase [Candidatus Omnitrophota bacterium]
MSRLPRINIESALYYVTTRSGHTYNIFIDDMDYKEYISLVAKYKDQYGFKLFSFSLLPARLEMLIELRNNAAISNIMHDITSLYTKIYNGKHGKKGHLFQQRFKALIAEKDAYLLQLTRQIHLSPVAEKIVSDPKSYQYSSHNMFLDSSKRGFPNMKAEIEEVFGMLKGREREFDAFVSKPDSKEIEEFKKILRKNRILGSDEFIEEVKNRIEENAKAQKKNQAPNKTQRLYLAAGGAAIVLLGMAIAYFYFQNSLLKTKYSKTINVYKSTLDMLKRERDVAIKANKDIETYVWKIRLTEQALQNTVREQKRTDKPMKEIEGFAWKIGLTQTTGASIGFPKEDVIYFENGQYTSTILAQNGFSNSSYTKTDLKNGVIIWRTIQANEKGETVSWRGEWDGSTMKGMMNMHLIDGAIRDFSFVSTGGRMEKNNGG